MFRMPELSHAGVEAARELRELQKDKERFEWFFSPSDKTPFLETYTEGIRTGWSVRRWRDVIDEAMAKESRCASL